MIREAVSLAMASKRSPVQKKVQGRTVALTTQPDPELELAMQVSLKAKVLAMVRTAINDVTPPLPGSAPNISNFLSRRAASRVCAEILCAATRVGAARRRVPDSARSNWL